MNNQQKLIEMFRTNHNQLFDNRLSSILKSGFFDLPKQESCNHPEHNPPTHLHIPEGKGYRHVCPGCGKQVILKNPINYFNTKNFIEDVKVNFLKIINDRRRNV